MVQLQSFEEFLVNQQVQIDYSYLILALILAALFSFILGKIYVKYGKSLSNRNKFSSNFNVTIPILRENLREMKLYSPIEIRRDGEMAVSSSISKENQEDVNISSQIDYSKLSEILDAI